MLFYDEIVRFVSIFSPQIIKNLTGFSYEAVLDLCRSLPLMKQLKVYTLEILRKTKLSNLSIILFYRENTTQVSLKICLWVNLKCWEYECLMELSADTESW